MTNPRTKGQVCGAALAVALLAYLAIWYLGSLCPADQLPEGSAVTVWERCHWSLEKLKTDRAGGSWQLKAELGQDTSLLNFLHKSVGDAELAVEDESQDRFLAAPGQYLIRYLLGGRRVASWLTVADELGPEMDLRTVSIPLGETVEPQAFILHAADGSAVGLRFEQEPDWEHIGLQHPLLIAEDEYGNVTRCQATLEIIDTRDHVPPVIEGAEDRTVILGESVLYKSGVTAADDRDGAVKLTVDSSRVNPLEEGSYPVTYSARDAAGNETSVTVIFTFEKPEIITEPAETEPETEPQEDPGQPKDPDVPQPTKPSGRIVNGLSVDNYDLNSLTRSVYNSIISVGMSDREKVTAIWTWTRSNIGYADMHHEGNWQDGAIYAFVMRRGSCYMFFSAAKALLQMAGVRQIDVVKRAVPGRSMHYWQLVNVDGAWYHLDSTPRKGDGGINAHPFLMWTDAQLLEYSEKSYDCFDFILTDYPRTPGTIPDRFLKPYYPQWFDASGQRIKDAEGHPIGTPDYREPQETEPVPVSTEQTAADGESDGPTEPAQETVGETQEDPLRESEQAAAASLEGLLAEAA